MRSKKIFGAGIIRILFVIIIISQTGFSQTSFFNWASGAGSGGYDYITGIEKDNAGNFIIGGSFYDSVRFGSTVLYVSGYTDMYTARYNSQGVFLDARRYGNSGSEYLNGMSADAQNNLIITGYYNSPPILLDNYFFISKYDQNGNLLWLTPVRSNGFDLSNTAIDGLNNITAAGSFMDTVTLGQNTLTPVGSRDALLVKFNSNGSVLWTRTLGSALMNFNTSLTAVSTNNDIFFAGEYYTGDTGTKFYYSRYDPQGSQRWLREGSCINYLHLRSISSDLSGNLIMSGDFDSTLTFGGQSFNSSDGDLFVAKISPEGNLLWFRSFLSGGLGGNTVKAMADPTGSIYLTGKTYDQSEATQMFIRKYSADGDLIWVHQIPEMDTEPADMVIANDYKPVFTGTFQNTVSFGGINLIANGGQDLFLAAANSPAVSLSPQNVDFGIIQPGNTSERSVTIFNSGNVPVYIKSVIVSGPDSSSFVITSGGGTAILQPQQSSTVNISFAPLNAGSKLCYLLIQSDAVTGVIPVTLSGRAESAVLIPESTLVDFGMINVNSTLIKPVLVINNSSIDVQIINAAISGNLQNEFILLNQVNVVAAGDTAAFQISFNPKTSGIKTAALIIQSNAQGSPHSIQLTGTGVESGYSAGDTIDFAQCNVSDSVASIISIKNSGTLYIQIFNVFIAGSNPLDFSPPPLLGQPVIMPGDSLEFLVYFRPSSTGKKNGILIIETNQPESPDSIFLIGRGTAPMQVAVESTGNIITATVSPPSGYTYTQNFLFYKYTGENSYSYIRTPFTAAGNLYTASIPAEYLTLRGIQYYISFSDGDVQVTYPEQDPVNNPAYIEVKYSVMDFPFTNEALQYRMITVPLTADDSTLAGTFQRNLGNPDPKSWRLLRWNPADSSYSEYPSLTEYMTPGKAFWLITSRSRTLNVNNITPLRPFDPYIMKLEPGWNQVANPYLFTVPWRNVDSLISEPVYYNPQTGLYDYNSVMLKPWEGCWIHNGYNNVIEIPIPARMDSIIGKVNAEYSYLLKLSFSAGKYRDAILIGSTVKSGRKENVFKPPLPDNSLSAGIYENNKIYGKRVKEFSDKGEFWDLTINSVLNDVINLNIERIHDIPDDFGIWILDLNKDKSLPVYKDFVQLSSISSVYRIIAGTKQFAETIAGGISLIPEELFVFQNYPNPFNPSTTITFSIPEKGHVDLRLFDVLGRELKILTDEDMEPGIHETRVDMENFSSGVYFYSVSYKNSVVTKKMIFIK